MGTNTAIPRSGDFGQKPIMKVMNSCKNAACLYIRSEFNTASHQPTQGSEDMARAPQFRSAD